MKEIAIIGAGPAGIEAAHILAQNNYHVHIFEKCAEPLSNIVDKAFLFPNFADAHEIAEKLKQKLQHRNIEVICNHNVDHIHSELTADSRGENFPPYQQAIVDNKQFDAAIIATGYTPFDAHKKEELGYGIYNGVITSLELESMIRSKSINSPTLTTPQRIVFLQCVGSRDEKIGNHYCSKLCCVTAVKQAIEVKKCIPNAEIYIFYMDLRMWGQGFEEMYRTAQSDYGIKFIRGRISEASNTFNNRIQIKAEDTLMGLPLKMTSDLLVLMVGMEASDGTKKLTSSCNICGEYGFAQSIDPHIADNKTHANAIYVAGSCKRPMTINDSINDGRSAAFAVMNDLK